MNWEEIRVADREPRLTFGNGESLRIRARERETPDGRFVADAIVGEAGQLIELPNVVDDGETTDAPRCWSLRGDPPDQMILFGGPLAYRVRTGAGVDEIPLWRAWEDSEFWETELAGTPYGTLIVYEAGVLLIAPDLSVRWHVRKYFNDRFVAVEADAVLFHDSEEVVWALSLTDGTRSPTDNQP